MAKLKKGVQKKFVFLSIAILLFIIGLLGYNYLKYLESVSNIDIYYLNTVNTGIESVEKRYESSLEKEEILNNVYEMFSTNQQMSTSTLVTAKPENLEILEYDIDEQGFMTVNFSQEYKEMTNIQEINFKSAFVWTFTDLEFVKKIKFEIDGLPYTTVNSQVIDYFDRTNVIVEPTIALDKVVQRDIVLYFVNQDEEGKSFLVKEPRTATADEGVTIEEVIVTELVKGSLEGNKSAIPEGVRIRQVKRENAICFIDLDDKFLKGNLTEREQKLRVYSLVNTLTELGNVDKVQILINAKKTKGFDVIDISKPLKRNEFYIMEE